MPYRYRLVVGIAVVACIEGLDRLAVVLVVVVFVVVVVEDTLPRFAIVGFADQLFGTHLQRSSVFFVKLGWSRSKGQLTILPRKYKFDCDFTVSETSGSANVTKP